MNAFRACRASSRTHGTRAPLRRRARHWFVALALIVGVLPITSALAAPPPPRGNGRPDLRSIIDFRPLVYWDSDYLWFGPGLLELEHVGNDPNNDTILLRVRLTQGGWTYRGSGVRTGDKLVFSVAGLFFQCDVPGWGSYHVVGDPSQLYWVYLGLP